MPSTARASSLTPPTVSHAVGRRRRRRRRPWRASSAPRPARARACLRSSSSACDARRQLLERRLELGRRRFARAAPASLAALRAAAPVSASMRRTPAATPHSDDDPDQPDVAGAPRHGCRRTARPTSRCVLPRAVAHRDDAHLVAVLLAEQRACAPARDRVVERHQPRRRPARSAARSSLAMSSTCASSSRRHRLGMREVEAQPVGRDQRALLRDVRRRAPGAAPRAADASPNGWRGSRARRAWSTSSASACADLERALLDRADDGRTGRRPSSACR